MSEGKFVRLYSFAACTSHRVQYGVKVNARPGQYFTKLRLVQAFRVKRAQFRSLNCFGWCFLSSDHYRRNRLVLPLAFGASRRSHVKSKRAAGTQLCCAMDVQTSDVTGQRVYCRNHRDRVPDYCPRLQVASSATANGASVCALRGRVTTSVTTSMRLCLLHAMQRSPCISVSSKCQSVCYRVPDQPPKPTPVEQMSTSRHYQNRLCCQHGSKASVHKASVLDGSKIVTTTTCLHLRGFSQLATLQHTT